MVAHKDEKVEGPDGKLVLTAAGQKYADAKAELPHFTSAGTFQPGTRKKTTLVQGTGTRKLDVDKVTRELAIAIRDGAKDLDYCVGAWLSSSGEGTHLFISQEPAADARTDHASWHAAATAVQKDLLDALGVTLDFQDKNVKDVSRASFVSYDPDAWLNPGAISQAWDPGAPAPAMDLFRGGTTTVVNRNGRSPEEAGKAVAAVLPQQPGDVAPDIDELLAQAGPLTEERYTQLRDALMRIPVPQDYNTWFGCLVSCKLAGLLAKDVEEWSGTGAKHIPEETYRKWDGLSLTARNQDGSWETVDEARSKILNQEGGFATEAPLARRQHTRLVKQLRAHPVPQDPAVRAHAILLAKRAGLRAEDVEGWLAAALTMNSARLRRPGTGYQI